MTTMTRHTVSKPVVYSITGIHKDRRIQKLKSFYIKEGETVVILQSQTSVTPETINHRLAPDVILCDNFKPEKSFLKKTRRVA